MDPIEFSPIISHQMIGDSQSLPIISGKYRRKISKYLFQKGTCHAKNSNKKHPAIDVPNFQVIKLMQIFKSKKYVRETFTGMHYHWFLTTEGIEFLRNYLNRPSEIVPNTLTKQPKPAGRHFGGPPGDRPRGPPHFVDGESRFGGDRDGHCGGPPGGPGGDSGGDKGGASADYGPSWVKVKLFSVTESGEPFVADIENMVDIGFDTETTMPKVSREKPRVVIDCYVGWELDVLSATNKEPNPRPVTVVEWQDISPDYDWSKLMPPTKRVRGELVVEPGWKYKPQFFRVWVYPKRDYMLGTEWLDIEVAAADNNFRILLEKGVERWCIFTALGLGPKDPKHSKDPWAFPKAIRFSELLATTNVPPSVVIDILYGRLGHRYLPIGCQQGGLCLKHYISHYAFNERYNRFISSTKDLLDILGPGILLYLTGNTICVVGKPEQDLQLDMVVSFAKRCIINNEEPANLLKVGSEWLQNLSKEQEETEQ